MRIVVIGDIHGSSQWERVVEREAFDMLIFLGDYFDSFTISQDDQIRNFKNLIGLGDTYDVVYLVGNHDLHYIYDFDKSSGYQNFPFPVIHAIRGHLDKFRVAHCSEDILFTHAGVTVDYLNRIANPEYAETPTDADAIADYLNDLWQYRPMVFRFDTEYINNLSNTGDNIDQSPLWIRPESLNNGTLGYNFKQVVGHTVIDKYSINYKFNGRNYFMDRLNSLGEYLVIEDRNLMLKQI